jgi:hypothetical protein
VTSPTTRIALCPDPPALLPAVVALVGLGLFDGGHGIRAADRVAQRKPLGELIPAGLPAGPIRHAVGDRPASQFRSIKIEPRLQDAVGQEIVERGIGALDNQCGKRSHRLSRVLDHLAHDLLEAVGNPVQLIPQGGFEAHVAADEIGIPADPNPEALHVPRPAHRHRPPAADRVEHVVADDAAAHARAALVDDELRPDAGWQAEGQCQQQGNPVYKAT